MLKLSNVTKKYGDNIILNKFNLEVNKGEFVTITGKSGAGKTTLINIIGSIDHVDDGDIVYFDILNPKKKDLKLLRRNNIGYMFQNYFLLENESVLNNIRIGIKRNQFKIEKAKNALIRVGLTDEILTKKVCELSGGEQQRVSLARAIIKDFDLLLADEPTGNLDDKNTDLILNLFKELKNEGKAIICATHDLNIANSSDRNINL